MTREQLDAIRARMEACTDYRQPPEVIHLVNAAHTLLKEVERLRDAHAMAVQVSGELCEKCGWAMKFPEEPCRCELLDGTERQALLSEIGRLKAEVERLTADPLPAAAWVREVERAAFQRGVVAMREAAAQKVTSYNIVVVNPVGRAFPVLESPLQTLADEIRALLDPEYKR